MKEDPAQCGPSFQQTGLGCIRMLGEHEPKQTNKQSQKAATLHGLCFNPYTFRSLSGLPWIMDYKLQTKPTLVPRHPSWLRSAFTTATEEQRWSGLFSFPLIYFLFLLYFLPSIYALVLCWKKREEASLFTDGCQWWPPSSFQVTLMPLWGKRCSPGALQLGWMQAQLGTERTDMLSPGGEE